MSALGPGGQQPTVDVSAAPVRVRMGLNGRHFGLYQLGRSCLRLGDGTQSVGDGTQVDLVSGHLVEIRARLADGYVWLGATCINFELGR